MTSADTEAMQALQELLDERQRYEGWIRALHERQNVTPPHVFSRVHTDYTLRLDRVMQRLSERTEQLRTTVDAAAARLATLRSKETDRTDTRHEAELRAAVGEYSDTEWTRLRSEADQEIETIATERKGVEEELSALERIIALTQAPVIAEQSVVATGTTNTTSTTPPPTPVLADAFPADSPEAEPSIEDFVADWPVRHVESAAQGDGTPIVPEVDKTPVITAKAAEQASAFVAPPATSTVAPAAGAPAAETAAVDSRRDQEKTLKCPECGAANYATEWYCERCGGELAAF